MHFFHQKILNRDSVNDRDGAKQSLFCGKPKHRLWCPPCGRALPGGLTAGFTLVELIVAVGILIILSATFLFSYGSFERQVTINVLAHQIAMWVHDAQVSAMSIRRSKTGVTAQEQFRSGYGLHFDTTTEANKSKFTYFADIDRNTLYTPLTIGQVCGAPSVECEQEVTLLQGNTISLLCGDMPLLPGDMPDCTSAVTGTLSLFRTDTLDISFVRPNPFDATILGEGAPPTQYGQAEITVTSVKGYHHTITVRTTGQVSVQ